MNKDKSVKSKSEACKSNWTPVNHGPSKEAIFKERLKLMTNWFDMWTHQQKCHFFDHFLKRCDNKQLVHIERYFTESVPIDKIDFTTIFPRHLSLYIFSFLDPKTFCRAAVVSWHWRFLTEQDVLWIPKCALHAWYLPFNPPQNQIGLWKRHYISCIKALDFKICQEEKSKWAKEQDDKQKKIVQERLSAKSQKLWKSIERNIKERSISARDPWTPSNKYPKDLTDKKNYFKNRNSWDCILERFGLQRMDSGSCQVSKWKEMGDTLMTMNDSDIKIMLAKDGHCASVLSDALKLENLKEKRITEMKEFQNKHPKYWDPDNVVENSLIPIPYNVTSEFYVRSEVRKVIFISSKVPAHDMLICSLRADVIPVLYDFDSTTLDSIAFQLQSFIKHAHHPSNIGFFTHRGKPGELLLTEHLKIASGCSNMERIVKFFRTITGLVEVGGAGSVDIFQPVACCEEMRELLITLSSSCGVEFRSPNNVVDINQIYDSSWFSTSNASAPTSPMELYFNIGRFMLWSKESDLMEEACSEVEGHLRGYFADVRRRMVSRAIGRIIYKNLGFFASEKMELLLDELVIGINMLQDCSEDELLTRLGKHLQLKSEENSIDGDGIESREKFDRSWIDDATLLSENKILKKQKQTIHKSKQLEILNLLISGERHYNRCMASIIDVYKKPVVVSLETNRALVSWQNARLLFDDVTKLFGISCQLLDDLKLLKNNPPSKVFLGQLFFRFLKSFKSLSSAYLLVYSAILETYDKCKKQSTHFRAFLKRFELSRSSLMLSLPELYTKPWKRVDEYSRILAAYRDALQHDHADIHDIDASIHSIGELIDSIDENVERMCLDRQMKILQDEIKNCPQLNEIGRHLIKELRASHMLAPSESAVPEMRVYRHKGDLHFYLFDDCLLCADVIVRSVPFENRTREERIFLQTSSLRFIRIKNIPDSQYLQNGFKMWTPKQEWICSVEDEATKFDWISTLEQTVKLNLNS